MKSIFLKTYGWQMDALGYDNNKVFTNYLAVSIQ